MAAKPYLADVSIEEMKAEIQRREQETKKAAKPKPLSNPDLRPVIALCHQYVNDLGKEGWADGGYDHWIFETAMQAVFGNDVWGWINTILGENRDG